MSYNHRMNHMYEHSSCMIFVLLCMINVDHGLYHDPYLTPSIHIITYVCEQTCVMRIVFINCVITHTPAHTGIYVCAVKRYDIIYEHQLACACLCATACYAHLPANTRFMVAIFSWIALPSPYSQIVSGPNGCRL